jgi:hypothetical protein
MGTLNYHYLWLVAMVMLLHLYPAMAAPGSWQVSPQHK